MQALEILGRRFPISRDPRQKLAPDFDRSKTVRVVVDSVIVGTSRVVETAARRTTPENLLDR